MIKLYLVRHGETEASQRGVYYGRHDSLLTEAGALQARRLADVLRDVVFDRVIVSGLKRTKQTADIVLAERAIKPEANPDFDELDFGDWEGCHYSQLAAQDNERYTAWCNDWINQAPPNGESFRQFRSRIEHAFNSLLASRSDETILFVGHQGVLRVIMLLLLKLPEQGFWHFTFEHGAYSLIEVEQGHAVIQKINATS